MRTALVVERSLLRRPPGGLATVAAPIPETASGRPAELCIDLVGEDMTSSAPVLAVRFDGSPRDARAVLALACGTMPEIEVRLDDRPVGRAWPMVDRRKSVALGADDVFARAVTLVCALVERFGKDGLATPRPCPRSGHGRTRRRASPRPISAAPCRGSPARPCDACASGRRTGGSATGSWTVPASPRPAHSAKAGRSCRTTGRISTRTRFPSNGRAAITSSSRTIPTPPARRSFRSSPSTPRDGPRRRVRFSRRITTFPTRTSSRGTARSGCCPRRARPGG